MLLSDPRGDLAESLGKWHTPQTPIDWFLLTCQSRLIALTTLGCVCTAGLIAYLGREFGVRTKRFALVVEDGIIKKVAVDEGVDNLDATSVESMIGYLRANQPMKAPEINGATVGGALVAGLALVLVVMELATNF